MTQFHPPDSIKGGPQGLCSPFLIHQKINHMWYLLIYAHLFASNMQTPAPTPPPSTFAVVELFTSQGCSSCPPADEVLSQLVDTYADSETPVYALSFHVDYWNYLGWNDPYSDAAYSQRQRNYAQALRSRVYTPQMIVNGRTEFVGSRSSEARQHVEDAIKRAGSAVVTASAGIQGKLVKVDLDTNAKRGVVSVALVERKVSNKVPRGENRNRTLQHDNVVRAFTQVKPSTKTAELLLPAGVDLRKSEVIVYVQEGPVGAVIGATRASIVEEAP